jgi:hypothetical protein
MTLMKMTTKAASQQRAGFSYIWLYLGALAGAELLAAGLNVSLSLWLHAGLLCFFLLRSYVTEGRESSFHVALAVLPLLRMLSLTIPLWLASPVNQLLLVNLPLITATFIAAWAVASAIYPCSLSSPRAACSLATWGAFSSNLRF